MLSSLSLLLRVVIVVGDWMDVDGCGLCASACDAVRKVLV